MSATAILRAQLEGIRATAEAALALLGEDPPAPPADGSCQHPPHARKPAAVGGDPGQTLCTACHTFVPGAGA